MELTNINGTCGTALGSARLAMPTATAVSTTLRTLARPESGSGRAWPRMCGAVKGSTVDVVDFYAQNIAKHDFPNRRGLISCSPPV